MEIGDVIITIEHCDQCDKHEFNTRHDESQYTKRTLILKQALNPLTLKFSIRFTTIMKPISKYGTMLPDPSVEDSNTNVGNNRPKSANPYKPRRKIWIDPIDPLPTEVKTRPHPDYYPNEFNYR